ncbi:membrane-associated Zn-dependent protease 1 [Raoultella ornithinolytica]|uniref:membrane-associated Zn-dependent protease 1 n=1 Tax=Raoultella ornithinolytica TaxID=54291 RepID=UPI0021AFBCDE|nr:membrane-associated Zn-dependent protease 1 [Raoultella ornithinolytica]MCT4737231.1 membrane-associated Zn-dependent protease 1 [Raoultella ornithinolytica]
MKNIVAGMLIIIGFISQVAHAQDRVHLLFHLGQVAGDAFSVGGTIENRSDVAVREGFVVIIPVDKACVPGRPVLQTFGSVAPGQRTTFSVAVAPAFSGYRLVGIGAVDNMGFPLPVTDDTRAVIAAREPMTRQACQASRHRE